MCQPASMIITRAAVYWHPRRDSHTAIRALHCLLEAGLGDPTDVAVEIVPPGGDYRRPLTDWIYRVDQDRVPDWYEAREAELAARAELAAWYASHVQTDPASHQRVGPDETLIALAGQQTVTGGVGRAYGSAQQTVTGGVGRAYGSAQQTVTGGVGHAYDWAQQTVTGGVGHAYDSAQQTVTGGEGRAYGSAQQTVTGGVGRRA